MGKLSCVYMGKLSCVYMGKLSCVYMGKLSCVDICKQLFSVPLFISCSSVKLEQQRCQF